MRTLLVLAAWLAARAGARYADAAGRPPPWTETTADRAGRLVPAPQDGLEQDVGRSLGLSWALWTAIAVVLLVVGVGYLRRRWRRRGEAQPARLTWRARR